MTQEYTEEIAQQGKDEIKAFLDWLESNHELVDSFWKTIPLKSGLSQLGSMMFSKCGILGIAFAETYIDILHPGLDTIFLFGYYQAIKEKPNM